MQVTKFVYCDGGKKHTHNADGRKGRGEQPIISVSSADKENNAGARGNLPQTSGTPDENLTQEGDPQEETCDVQ